MADTRTQDDLRNLERRAGELEAIVARIPVRPADAGTGAAIKCYQINRCRDDFPRYISNKACKDHLPGGSDEDKPIAVIEDEDGGLVSWRLVGNAPECKSAECVPINWWLPACPEDTACWLLDNCGEGENLIYRGASWAWYSGLILKIDGVCYTITPTDDCAEAVDMEAPLTEDVLGPYPSCEECDKCYELTDISEVSDCNDLGELAAAPHIYVINDLITELNTYAPLGKTVKSTGGICYKITASISPCVGSETYIDLVKDSRGYAITFNPCDQCTCYLLTPCAESGGGAGGANEDGGFDDPLDSPGGGFDDAPGGGFDSPHGGFDDTDAGGGGF